MQQKEQLNIYTVQMNPTVGALDDNSAYIAAQYAAGRLAGADIVLTPEMSLAGYPLEDLVLIQDFLKDAWEAAEKLAGLTDAGTALLFGCPVQENGQTYNAMILAYDGKVQQAFYKKELPNYGVFDEKRIFASGIGRKRTFGWKGHIVGVFICEDGWFDAVCAEMLAEGATLGLSANASPWDMYKYDLRQKTIWKRVHEIGLPIVYVNQWGGQDELVFDGNSFALNPEGKVYQAQGWGNENTLLVFDGHRLTLKAVLVDEGILLDWGREDWKETTALGAIYVACVTSLRDYFHKNGFKKAVIALSGGIDSTYALCVAVDALGAENVVAIMMPSPFSSDHSITDSCALAQNLGVRIEKISIDLMMKAFHQSMAHILDFSGVTGENLQSRIRGTAAMAFANRFGYLLVTTGNKAEASVGYCTIYGDMAGAFNPLKDLYKMTVYAVSAWRNSDQAVGLYGKGDVIPENILTKAPSAELAEGQQDSDSLPPYPILDAILFKIVEEGKGPQTIYDEGGFDTETIMKIWNLVLRAEWKRRQGAPGTHLSLRSWGVRDLRRPITLQWKADIKKDLRLQLN